VKPHPIINAPEQGGERLQRNITCTGLILAFGLPYREQRNGARHVEFPKYNPQCDPPAFRAFWGTIWQLFMAKLGLYPENGNAGEKCEGQEPCAV
jgi:hypothetical protein